MFDKKKYMTSGINKTLGLEMQILLWSMIDDLNLEKDYLQVFELIKLPDSRTKIIHRQEVPEYKDETIISIEISTNFIKVFVIDDGDYSTMLLADEY